MKKATTTMTQTKSGPKEGKGGDSPSALIDARIKELDEAPDQVIPKLVAFLTR